MTDSLASPITVDTEVHPQDCECGFCRACEAELQRRGLSNAELMFVLGHKMGAAHRVRQVGDEWELHIHGRVFQISQDQAEAMWKAKHNTTRN